MTYGAVHNCEFVFFLQGPDNISQRLVLIDVELVDG